MIGPFWGLYSTSLLYTVDNKEMKVDRSSQTAPQVTSKAPRNQNEKDVQSERERTSDKRAPTLRVYPRFLCEFSGILIDFFNKISFIFAGTPPYQPHLDAPPSPRVRPDPASCSPNPPNA